MSRKVMKKKKNP